MSVHDDEIAFSSSQNSVPVSTTPSNTNNTPTLNQTQPGESKPQKPVASQPKPLASPTNQSLAVATSNTTSVQNMLGVSQPNLLAIAQPSNVIHLSWNTVSKSKTYDILRSNSSQYGSFNPIVRGISITSYDDTGLLASAIYYYDIYAVSNGSSTLIGTVSAIKDSTTMSTTYDVPTWIKNNAKW